MYHDPDFTLAHPCKPTRDAAQAHGKPTISNAAALTIVMAMRHLDSRLQVLEQQTAPNM